MKKRSLFIAVCTAMVACAAMVACGSSSKEPDQIKGPGSSTGTNPSEGSNNPGETDSDTIVENPGTIAGNFVAGESFSPSTVKVETLVENSNGLSYTMWTHDGKFATDLLRDFGRRSHERTGFWSWQSVETSKNVYNASKVSTIVNRLTSVQKIGGTPIISLNNIAGPWFLSGMGSQIPSFYPQNPADATTIAAGKKYIDYMVRTLLQSCGQLVVAFDYEMFYNCSPDNDTKRQMLRNWFIAAADQAASTATSLGMRDKLTIMPIVNGSCTTDDFCQKFFGSPFTNHVAAQWLKDIMAHCDVMGIDNYHIDMSNKTSSDATIAAWEFWIKYYSLGKPVILAETGFSSGMTQYPTYKPPKTSDKAIGTEAEQSTFFSNLTAAVRKENVPGGKLRGQVRVLNVWMHSDFDMGKDTPERQNHFGIVRMDKTRKPAFGVLQKFSAGLDDDPSISPSKVLPNPVSVSGEVSQSNQVKTVYKSGQNLDRIVVTFATEKDGVYKLKLDFVSTGSTVVKIGSQWLYLSDIRTPEFMFMATDDQTTVWIFPTDGKVPFTQNLKGILLEKQIKVSD